MSSIPSSAMPHAVATPAYDEDQDWDDTNDSSWSGSGLMEKARGNKTGFAIGVAVGAVAAAAVPFLLSGRGNSAPASKSAQSRTSNGSSKAKNGTTAKSGAKSRSKAKPKAK